MVPWTQEPQKLSELTRSVLFNLVLLRTSSDLKIHEITYIYNQKKTCLYNQNIAVFLFSLNYIPKCCKNPGHPAFSSSCAVLGWFYDSFCRRNTLAEVLTLTDYCFQPLLWGLWWKIIVRLMKNRWNVWENKSNSSHQSIIFAYWTSYIGNCNLVSFFK